MGRGWRDVARLGFLAPTEVGERWLGEAEMERGNGAALKDIQRNLASAAGPLSDRFAAISPPLCGGEEPKSWKVAAITAYSAASYPAMPLISKKSSSPYSAYSRPLPDCL